MSVFDSASRDELRRAYCEAWRKRREHAIETPLETQIADVIALHPEYQTLIADAETAKLFEPPPGDPNPFFHMGLHLAVRDQAAVDRPPGIRELHRRLAAHDGDAHRAEHALMDALAETLIEAHRAGAAPDEMRYMERARRRLKS